MPHDGGATVGVFALGYYLVLNLGRHRNQAMREELYDESCHLLIRGCTSFFEESVETIVAAVGHRIDTVG